MKIRATAGANRQDLAIGVNTGDIIAFNTLIIAAAWLCASRNVFHIKHPLCNGFTARQLYFHCKGGKEEQEESRMAEQMEILLKTENKPEAEEILQLLDEMSPAEQRDMLMFMQGARYIKGLARKTTAPATQNV